MTTKTVFTATYSYPGVLFAEEITRELDAPTYAEALRCQPADTGTYFAKDGWYAVRIKTQVMRLYVSGDDHRWLPKGSASSESWVIGERVHYSALTDEKDDILRSNIEYNSKDGYGVKTRCGNWQIASDYDHVVLT